MTATHKPLAWALLAALAAALAYGSFVGYLNPELLIGYAYRLAC